MLDYTSMGLKAGLEIHQQLDTKKLFCACPSQIRDDQPDIIVRRMLRASAGETGMVDVAAAYEMRKEKHFIYHAYSDTTCLVEMDCEPIHPINKEALKIALQIALMLKAKPVDRIEVMRKTVVDGSNTSGFQRTALIARNGSIATSKGIVKITGIALEEESAKIAQRTTAFDVYNLSRLGIPLIEISTEADIISPEHAKETAEKLGMILRSGGRVKRGLGTIRQDVNISIKGGARVEIKGAQELRLIPKLIEYEAMRQNNLLEIKKELKGSVSKQIHDIGWVFSKTKSELIQNALKNGKVMACVLKGFKGKIGRELMPGRRLGKEFSEYAKAYAGVKGAIHTDELPKYDISAEEISDINTLLGCGENDAFIFIADNEEKAILGLAAIQKRAQMLFEGVPQEVRKANDDGTTSFLRPMPGSSRMYPETDARSVVPDLENIEIPELIKDKAERYSSLGISKDVANNLSKSPYHALFEELAEKFKNIDPVFLAQTLLSTQKEIKTRFGINAQITETDFREALSYLDNGNIAKEAVFELLLERSKGKIIKEIIHQYELLSDEALEKELDELVKKNEGMPFNALIGRAMEKLRGKATSQKIIEFLKKRA